MWSGPRAVGWDGGWGFNVLWLCGDGGCYRAGVGAFIVVVL